MSPVLVVFLLGTVFAGTHIGLTVGPVRRSLVSRLGERGFAVFFSAVAWFSFALFAAYYAEHRFDGLTGPALGHIVLLRWLLVCAIVAGVVLMTAGLSRYLALPMALFSKTARPPKGLERITRHPFFAGFALFLLAHVLLAEYLIGTVFFAALALLTVIGAWHQDQKLRSRMGPIYSEYLSVTSAVPFAAILAGNQRLVLNELPWIALILGLVLAALLKYFHAQIWLFNGAPLIAGFFLGSSYFLLRRWRYGQAVG